MAFIKKYTDSTEINRIQLDFEVCEADLSKRLEAIKTGVQDLRLSIERRIAEGLPTQVEFNRFEREFDQIETQLENINRELSDSNLSERISDLRDSFNSITDLLKFRFADELEDLNSDQTLESIDRAFGLNIQKVLNDFQEVLSRQRFLESLFKEGEALEKGYTDNVAEKIDAKVEDFAASRAVPTVSGVSVDDSANTVTYSINFNALSISITRTLSNWLTNIETALGVNYEYSRPFREIEKIYRQLTGIFFEARSGGVVRRRDVEEPIMVRYLRNIFTTFLIVYDTFIEITYRTYEIVYDFDTEDVSVREKEGSEAESTPRNIEDSQIELAADQSFLSVNVSPLGITNEGGGAISSENIQATTTTPTTTLQTTFQKYESTTDLHEGIEGAEPLYSNSPTTIVFTIQNEKIIGFTSNGIRILNMDGSVFKEETLLEIVEREMPATLIRTVSGFENLDESNFRARHDFSNRQYFFSDGKIYIETVVVILGEFFGDERYFHFRGEYNTETGAVENIENNFRSSFLRQSENSFRVTRAGGIASEHITLFSLAEYDRDITIQGIDVVQDSAFSFFKTLSNGEKLRFTINDVDGNDQNFFVSGDKIYSSLGVYTLTNPMEIETKINEAESRIASGELVIQTIRAPVLLSGSIRAKSLTGKIQAQNPISKVQKVHQKSIQTIKEELQLTLNNIRGRSS